MHRLRLGFVILALLVSVAVAAATPAHSQQLTSKETSSNLESILVSLLQPVGLAGSGECSTSAAALPDAGVRSVASPCVAQCQYGSNQVCYGNPCSASNQSCPGTRGYCYSPSEGYKYCSACPSCSFYGCKAKTDPDAFCRGKCPVVCTDPAYTGYCDESIDKCVCGPFVD